MKIENLKVICLLLVLVITSVLKADNFKIVNNSSCNLTISILNGSSSSLATVVVAAGTTYYACSVTSGAASVDFIDIGSPANCVFNQQLNASPGSCASCSCPCITSANTFSFISASGFAPPCGGNYTFEITIN
jgi:hypothetical protein